MSSISHGLVLTTAMVLSTTLLYLTFSKQKSSFQIHETSNSNNKPILRSCLYSEEKKREKRRKKKKVKFSENVMVKEEESESNEEIREKQGKKKNRVVSINKYKCRNGIHEERGMPANRIALYNGILRDRVQRMGYCH